MAAELAGCGARIKRLRGLEKLRGNEVEAAVVCALAAAWDASRDSGKRILDRHAEDANG